MYSFVPIPGAQQHKRPRRRYEEIERMYKCGWNGCEKAYGTLNHLNAHVTMQSHGQKRTPEGMSFSVFNVPCDSDRDVVGVYRSIPSLMLGCCVLQNPFIPTETSAKNASFESCAIARRESVINLTCLYRC